MVNLDLAFPIDGVPSRRQLIENNTSGPVSVQSVKIYPHTDPVTYDILPQFFYTVYVSGSNDAGTETKESVYTIPIYFVVDLFVGTSDTDVISLQATKGPRGVKTLSNDIHYYHYHDFLGADASSQSVSGIPPAYGETGSKKDSQSGLNTFYHITKVDPFVLPAGMHMFMDVSATVADNYGLSSVSSTWLKDNPNYDASVSVFYHTGQDVNGTFQYMDLYNSSVAEMAGGSLETDSPLLNVLLEYDSPQLPTEASFSRLRLCGSSYTPSANEVVTSSTQFVTVAKNDQYQTHIELEGVEVPSGKGNLTITNMKIYAAEYNISEKAVYDMYKLRQDGVLEPMDSRFAVYASSSDLVYNTMNSIVSGVSSLDMVDLHYKSQLTGPMTLKHRSTPNNDDGESLVIVCRENSLGGTGFQDLVVYYEGFYEQRGATWKILSDGRKFVFNHNSGRWEIA